MVATAFLSALLALLVERTVLVPSCHCATSFSPSALTISSVHWTNKATQERMKVALDIRFRRCSCRFRNSDTSYSPAARLIKPCSAYDHTFSSVGVAACVNISLGRRMHLLVVDARSVQ
ncbi:hypothetical protein BDY19DRAFT_140263 [Irpex rosettiformis]|uniref:Uncharacterized protein n=1 Tax=Irpex rosettiformis TaxID=378272 RepID=A0ACB8U570_9APHY|nr:hypothetical protein BDY19DRAFT_140263 [Irpex rosettiformis]